MFKKGDTSYWKGKKLSKEHRRKLSESHKGSITGFQNGHEFLGDLSKPNYFQKGDVPWDKGKLRPEMIGNTYAKRKHTLEENIAKGKRNIGNTYAKGCKHSKEARLAKSKRQLGENSHFWEGGLTDKNATIRNGIDFKLWRESVYERDNYTCQKCDEKGGKLHPHHINNFADYPELRFIVSNGVTLCKECHKLFHGEYGLRKTNLIQLDEFLNNTINIAV